MSQSVCATAVTQRFIVNVVVSTTMTLREKEMGRERAMVVFTTLFVVDLTARCLMTVFMEVGTHYYRRRNTDFVYHHSQTKQAPYNYDDVKTWILSLMSAMSSACVDIDNTGSLPSDSC